jgi:hypothetical protein
LERRKSGDDSCIRTKSVFINIGTDMIHSEPPPHPRVLRYCLTTKEIAAQYRAKEQTVRKQHAATGAYCGVRPLKLENGRLMWPEQTIEQLAKLRLGDAA